MRRLDQIDDPVFEAKEHNFIDKFFLNYIKDERDLPFVYLCLQMTFILIPFAALLYTSLFTGWYWIIAAAVYAVMVVYYAGPYTLMLHNTSHRPFFKYKYNFANNYIPWVLGPFIGQTPETYYSHHIGMHHAENNLEEDRSSTMKYQRDSILDFLKYSVSFFFIGVAELYFYFKEKGIKKFANMVLRGESSWILIFILLCFINWKVTFYVFFVPLVIVRFSMMAGNWGQHAFIDKNTPENNYRNSITCINHVYNKKCFNDGYHIGHHLHPHMHWTDMPKDFMKNNQKYAEEDAIVFEGLDFNMVWAYLMLRRYDLLAKHFVNLGNRFESNEQVIDMLKARTQKIA